MDLNSTQLKDIFDHARTLPEDMRAAYIAVVCGDDPAGKSMAMQVATLLADLAEADSFFDMSADGGAAVLAAGIMAETQGSGEGVGSMVGPYKLLEEIGEGGFGLVYMAEQEHPIRRRVAIKIIKLGLETNQVIARFEQERQALAMMDHPHIARVLDAGSTPAGRPYFAMELVRGEPITTFCDQKRMSIPERLQLFAKVCHAVQHAHQKGIIHRDLKPSNVLVAVGDGDIPVPKVIDFGIAKATESRLTDKTLFTEFRQMIGTPAYMSPEQAGMGAAGGLDIDTRSDVYALGALLYELLTGVTPFDAQRMRSAAFGELQRIIREDDPPRPSTRVSTVATIADVAARRQIDPKRLGLLVRGELDWIVMRCLEKDRARRYATADDLARDLNRYLKQEPLEAGPPTAAYRVRKFVRRNKGKVVLATALVGMLFATSISASIGLAWVARERTVAVLAREDEAQARLLAEASEKRALEAEAAAITRAEELDQIARTQASMLSGFDPSALGSRLRGQVREAFLRAIQQGGTGLVDAVIDPEGVDRLLEQVNFTDLAVKNLQTTVFESGVERIEESLDGQPLIKAKLLTTIGESIFHLGRYGDAALLGERVVELRREAAGPEHPSTLEAIHNLGYAYRYDHRLSLAEPLWREVMETRLRLFGPDDHASQESIYTMGILMGDLGRSGEAEPYLRTVIEYARSRPEARELLRWAIADLGVALVRLGRFEEAEPVTLEALAMRRSDLGEDHRDTYWSLANLAHLRRAQSRYDEAESYYRAALAGRRRLLGDEHRLTLINMDALASLLESRDREAEAMPLRVEIHEAYIRTVGIQHEWTLQAQRRRAILLHRAGELELAEAHLRAALTGFRRQAAAMPIDTIGLRMILTDLNGLMRDQGRLEEAAAFGAEALAVAREGFGDADRRLHRHVIEQARTLRRMERFAEAEALFIEADALPRADLARFPELATHKARREFIGEKIDLYDAWHAAEPDAGHDATAEQWRAKLAGQ
jgi:eukaryotic-like serine/threonine-protein kinase